MDIVDRLTKAGAKSKLKPIQSFASLSHVLSEIREKNPIKNWKEHIEDHPIKDDSLFFKNSQVLHPSLKPPKWLKKVNRPITSRLTQFITGHGYTTEYFERFKIPNRGACGCSTSTSSPYPPVPLSREHAIKACPLFEVARESLRRHAPRISHRKWPTSGLLKKDLLEHFITFLSESGALSRKHSTATGEPRPSPKNRTSDSRNPLDPNHPTRGSSPTIMATTTTENRRMERQIQHHSGHGDRQEHGPGPHRVGRPAAVEPPRRSIQIVTTLFRPAPTISTTPPLFSHGLSSDQTCSQGRPQPSTSTSADPIRTERTILQSKDPTT
jgi:hypothetical protein